LRLRSAGLLQLRRFCVFVSLVEAVLGAGLWVLTRTAVFVL
jgi:hypothetical protein